MNIKTFVQRYIKNRKREGSEKEMKWGRGERETANERKTK
jgi:hypothetical protein